jgi:hypothetical protein
MKKLMLIAIFSLLFMANAFALNIDKVETFPSTVEPGNIATIKLKIENSLEDTVTNIIVKLDLSSSEIPISPAGSSTQIIDEIDENDKENVEFDVIVLPNAKPGIYKIPVLITYNNITKEDVISFIVDTEAKLTLSVGNPDYIIGDRSTIDIKIINNGLADVQFLNIKLGNSAFYDVISAREIYVGDLDSDDYDTAEFDIKINYPLPGNLPIKVYVEYTDKLNNQHSIISTVEIEVYTEKEAKNLGLMETSNTPFIIAGIVALIIVLIAYRKIKKRRKQ